MKPSERDREMAQDLIHDIRAWASCGDVVAISRAFAQARAEQIERDAALIERRGKNNVGMVHHIDQAHADAIRAQLQGGEG